MKANFNKLFKAKPLNEQQVPNFVIDYLNRSLHNDDLKYIRGKGEGCILVSKDDKEWTISGLELELTEAQKTILGAKPTLDEILKYSYNSQEEIKTKNNSKVLVNGQEIDVNKFSTNPFSVQEYEQGHFAIFPKEFPEYRNMVLENGPYTVSLKIKRIANQSIDEEKYITEENKILNIIIIHNTKSNSSKLKAYFHNDVKGTFDEIIASAYIFNGIITGETRLQGQTESLTSPSSASLISNETLRAWKKIKELEKVLGLKIVTTPQLEKKDFLMAIKLYHSLIKKEPIKSYEKINSISFNEFEMEQYEKSKNKEIFLTFDNAVSVDFFGNELSLFMLTFVFHVKMGGLREDDEYTIQLSEVEGKREFLSSIYFLSEKELEDFKTTSNVNNDFYRAKYIKDCIEHFGD